MAVGVQFAVPADKTIKFRVLRDLMMAPGDAVEIGDVLFTYEDGDLIGEVESPAPGMLLEYFWDEGDEVPFYQNVCAVGKPGEDVSAMRPFAKKDAAKEEGDSGDETDDGADGGTGVNEEPEPVYEDPIEKIKQQMELITRKNMIVQVSEFILQRCEEDFEFYQLVNHPKKKLENCIKYINNRAKKHCEELAKLNGNGPGGTQCVAIEGDQVFTWAVEYFGAVNLTEDGYRPPSKPKTGKASKKKAAKSVAQKGAAKTPAEKSEQDEPLQLTLM